MSEYDDFLSGLSDSEEEEAPSNIQERVTRLVHTYEQLSSEIADLSRMAAEKQREVTEIIQKKLPDALLEAGLSEIKTLEGVKVTTGIYVGSIPRENKEEAFEWFDTNGHGDIIKRSVSVEFQKGQEELSETAVQALKEIGFEPITKKDIHHQTFASIAKDLVKRGVSVPLDKWGVYNGQQAKITKPKTA